MSRINSAIRNAKKAARKSSDDISAKLKEKPKSSFAEEKAIKRAEKAASNAAVKPVNNNEIDVAMQTNTTNNVAKNQVQKNQAEIAKANEAATSAIDETAGFDKYRPFNSTRSALSDFRQNLVTVKNPDSYVIHERFGMTGQAKMLAGGLFVAGAVDNTLTAGIDQTSTSHMQSVGTMNPSVNPVASSSIGTTPNSAFDNMGASGDINFALRRNNTLTPGIL